MALPINMRVCHKSVTHPHFSCKIFFFLVNLFMTITSTIYTISGRYINDFPRLASLALCNFPKALMDSR